MTTTTDEPVAPASPSADGAPRSLKQPRQVRDYGLMLTISELADALNMSRTTIWRHAASDPSFPKPRRICNVKRWITAEVVDYIEALPHAGQAR